MHLYLKVDLLILLQFLEQVYLRLVVSYRLMLLFLKICQHSTQRVYTQLINLRSALKTFTLGGVQAQIWVVLSMFLNRIYCCKIVQLRISQMVALRLKTRKLKYMIHPSLMVSLIALSLLFFAKIDIAFPQIEQHFQTTLELQVVPFLQSITPIYLFKKSLTLHQVSS